MVSLRLTWVGLFALLAVADFGLAKPKIDVIETDDSFGPIQKCPKGLNDKELSKCLSEIILGMNSLFKDGIPEIGLQSIDPFLLDSFEHTMHIRPIVVSTKFTNIRLYGLSKYEMAEFKLDMKNKRMSFKLGSPLIRAEANYEVTGNFFLLNMLGNGPAWIDITGGVAMGEASFKIGKDSTGNKIIQVDEFVLDLGYDDAKLEATGLFNRHQTLKRSGALLNRLMNDYHRELYDIIKPELIKPITEITKGLLNQSFAKMPFMAEYF